MNTYNLSFVFSPAVHVFTIVCASEEPLDHQEINNVAMKYFHMGSTTQKDVLRLISSVVSGIKEECGCEAVLVTADSSFVIQPKNPLNKPFYGEPQL